MVSGLFGASPECLNGSPIRFILEERPAGGLYARIYLARVSSATALRLDRKLRYVSRRRLPDSPAIDFCAHLPSHSPFDGTTRHPPQRRAESAEPCGFFDPLAASVFCGAYNRFRL